MSEVYLDNDLIKVKARYINKRFIALELRSRSPDRVGILSISFDNIIIKNSITDRIVLEAFGQKTVILQFEPISPGNTATAIVLYRTDSNGESKKDHEILIATDSMYIPPDSSRQFDKEISYNEIGQALAYLKHLFGVNAGYRGGYQCF